MALLSKQAEVTAGSTGSGTPHLAAGREGKKLECLCDEQTEPTERVTKARGRRPWPRGGAGGDGRPTKPLLTEQKNNPKKVIKIFSTGKNMSGLGNDKRGRGLLLWATPTQPGGEFDFPKVMLHRVRISTTIPECSTDIRLRQSGRDN